MPTEAHGHSVAPLSALPTGMTPMFHVTQHRMVVRSCMAESLLIITEVLADEFQCQTVQSNGLLPQTVPTRFAYARSETPILAGVPPEPALGRR